MRPLCFLLFCVGVLSCALCHAEGRLPIQLSIENDGVEARSGPGAEFYATDLLPVGTKIEVHRRKGDWLGIRPPEGSFSLMQKSQLRMTGEPSVAEVTVNDAMCRIGSNVDKIKDHASQVRLKKGELVAVVDTKQVQAELTDRGWCRIEPPAGEFRWVHAEDLQNDRAAHAATKTAENEPDREVVQVRQDDQDVYGTTCPREPASEEKTEPAAKDSSETQDATDKWVSRNGAATDSLDEIGLQFSLMVAQEMRAWRLSQLRDRVEAVASRLKTDADKSRAQLLLERIGEFEKLQNRFVAAGGDALVADGNSSGTAVSGDPQTPARADTGVRYDGMGWLVPVHSTKRVAPPYALLDAEGDVLQYVSPAPGLNLRRYAKKQVGIFGQRGYLPALKKSHLTAERIIDVERHLR